MDDTQSLNFRIFFLPYLNQILPRKSITVTLFERFKVNLVKGWTVQTIAGWQAWWRGEDVLDRFALSASLWSPTYFPSLFRGKVLILHPFQKKLVERGGFEPPKASPTDLQSVPFGRSGTSPTLNPFLWLNISSWYKKTGKSMSYISGIRTVKILTYYR